LLFPVSLEKEQISSESLEAARITANKHMIGAVGKDNFRENLLAVDMHWIICSLSFRHIGT
jgi:ribosomal protein L16/L10AE